MKEKKVPSNYAEAGIDLRSEANVLKTINQYVKKTFEFGNVVGKEGHYANMIKFGNHGLAMSADGVGTKLIVAQKSKKYDSIGIDCVAMNVNDLLALGILPHAFVDYLAVSELEEEYIEQIIRGLYEGCKIAGIPLIGGELATIPELLAEGKNMFDLSGTALGIVELDKAIDGSKIEEGDVVIGIASSGIHSNGFTIARKVLSVKYSLDEKLPWDKSLSEELLIPTRIYVQAVKELIEKCEINGLAHITGGGFKKLFRITKKGFEITKLPKHHDIFEEIKELGNISYHEMFSVFNMGIGFVVVLPKNEVENALQILNNHFPTYVIGKIVEESIISIPQYNIVFTRWR